MIYEAINIPCIVDNELPSPYIKINVAESYARTHCIKNSVWPVWYEAFEIKVFLPINLSLAPDIRVSVGSLQKYL
jgi:Ca2+-dependent lipid-binding protein